MLIDRSGWIGWLLSGCLLSGLLGGCSTARVAIGPYTDENPDPVQASGSSERLVQVPYITTRNVESNSRSETYYGDNRGTPSAGHCVVALGKPSATRVNARVKAVVEEPGTSVPASLQADRVVVYVHGYNIGFEKGCRRAAYLQESLDVSGRLLLFGWPADSSYLNYLHDVADLEWSKTYLAEVLATLSARFGAGNLDLIGHSLGARGLVMALAQMNEDNQPEFATLTLIAPDIDRDQFEQQLAKLRRLAGQVTVYASANDKALGVSRRANGYPRAGQAVSGLDYPGVDLVDVTANEVRGFSGHIYHLHTAAVVEDLRRVLRTSNGVAQFKRVAVASTYQLVPVAEP